MRGHVKGAELVDRPAEHLVARAFIHGQGFPRHYGLVDRGLPFEDRPIHDDGFSGQHAQHVSDLHLLRRDDFFPSIPHHAGGRGRQMDQLFDPGAGLRHGALFQITADGHDKGHFTRGKSFSDHDGSDQCDGHQDIRFDVESGYKTGDGTFHDRDAAEQNWHPGRVDRQVPDMEEADDQRGNGKNEEKHSPFSLVFQECNQENAPFYTARGICILYQYGYIVSIKKQRLLKKPLPEFSEILRHP